MNGPQVLLLISSKFKINSLKYVLNQKQNLQASPYPIFLTILQARNESKLPGV